MCGEKVQQVSIAVSATIDEEEKDQFDLLDKFRVTFLHLLDKFRVSSYVYGLSGKHGQHAKSNLTVTLTLTIISRRNVTL